MAPNNTVSSPRPIRKRFDDLINGITAHAPAGGSELAVGGTSYKTADLITQLTAYRDVYKKVEDTGHALELAVAARASIETKALAFLSLATRAVKAAVGPANPATAEYGIKPDKARTPLTPQQLLERKARAAATRKARGTMGKKQKSTIHGVVPPPATTTNGSGTASNGSGTTAAPPIKSS